MLYVVIYLALGLAFVSALRTTDDQSVFRIPALAALCVVIWPYVVFNCIARAEKLTIRGKVIWERKS